MSALVFVAAALFVLVVMIAVIHRAGVHLSVRPSLREFWVGFKVVPIQGATIVMIAIVPCVVIFARRRWRMAPKEAIGPPPSTASVQPSRRRR